MPRETRSTLVNRDPFAREELHRERVHNGAVRQGYLATKFECAWCGRTSCSPLARVPYLFRYTVETDSGRKYPDNKLFCCLPCRRAYNAH